jgi:hypothetical protein
MVEVPLYFTEQLLLGLTAGAAVAWLVARVRGKAPR